MAVKQHPHRTSHHHTHSEVWDIPVNELPNKAAELWDDWGTRRSDSACDDRINEPHLASVPVSTRYPQNQSKS